MADQLWFMTRTREGVYCGAGPRLIVRVVTGMASHKICFKLQSPFDQWMTRTCAQNAALVELHSIFRNFRVFVYFVGIFAADFRATFVPFLFQPYFFIL